MGNHFGRIPIVIHLSEFLQSLVEDLNGKDDEGNYKYPDPPSLEVQYAIKVFSQIEHVFELRGTKRFKDGDPLTVFLTCMRQGKRFPKQIWEAVEKTFASD